MSERLNAPARNGEVRGVTGKLGNCQFSFLRNARKLSFANRAFISNDNQKS